MSSITWKYTVMSMAQRQNSRRDGPPTKQVAIKANEAFLWVTGAFWQIYRTVLSGGAERWVHPNAVGLVAISGAKMNGSLRHIGPSEMLIPAHTRDAFFQLWCDLRTNVPKDRNWLRSHAAALQPKTRLGYLVSIDLPSSGPPSTRRDGTVRSVYGKKAFDFLPGSSDLTTSIHSASSLQALAAFSTFLAAGGTTLLCLAMATAAVLGYAIVGIVLVAGDPIRIQSLFAIL